MAQLRSEHRPCYACHECHFDADPQATDGQKRKGASTHPAAPHNPITANPRPVGGA